GQCVDQARLADIGAAGKRDLEAGHRRQRVDGGGRPDEFPVAGEDAAALLDQVRITLPAHDSGLRDLLLGGPFRRSGARAKRASPKSMTTTGTMDSGPAPCGASRNNA